MVAGLAAIGGVLVAAQVLGVVLRFGTGHDYGFGLIPFFDRDSEHNAPALFSTGLFVINALLFFRVALVHGLLRLERSPAGHVVPCPRATPSQQCHARAKG